MLNQTLNNRYTVTALLGEGAMGQVFRATDAQTGQEVAVKVITPKLAFDEEMLARFRREGEALRHLRHSNIVAFVDMFQVGQEHAIVMEYVPGGSLHSLMRRGPLPIDRALRITLELSDALARAHLLKIIHRDIKPENVLLAEDGTPRLTDFGVARLLSETQRLTGTGTQMGTPYYMSPEAWEGRKLDEQADIWSLGVMLFEMLAGQVPFAGETMAAVMNRVLTTPPPDLRTLRPDVPPALVKIIQRMLARDKARRYASMREVALDLERVAKDIADKEAARAKRPEPAAKTKAPETPAKAKLAEAAAKTQLAEEPAKTQLAEEAVKTQLAEAPETRLKEDAQRTKIATLRPQRAVPIAAAVVAGVVVVGLLIAAAGLGWSLLNHANATRPTQAAQTPPPAALAPTPAAPSQTPVPPANPAPTSAPAAVPASTSAPASVPGAAGGKWCAGVHIVFFPGGTEGGAFAANVYNGARQAQADLGPSVDYAWSDWDPQKMLQQFHDAVAAKPDGIAIMGHPGDQAFDPLIDAAESQGIIVTSQNVALPAAEAKYAANGFGYAGADPYQTGHDLAVEAIQRFSLQKGDRALVWGTASSLRTQGVKDALSKAGLAIDYLEMDAATMQDPMAGRAPFAAYMSAHPAVKLVIADRYGLTEQIDEYLKAALKKPGDIKVGSFDLSAASVVYIKGGWTSLVIDQQGWLQGYLPILQVCLTKVYGFSGLHINTGAGFVDQNNVDAIAPYDSMSPAGALAAPTAGKWCGTPRIVFFPGGTQGGVFAVNVYNGAVQAVADLGPRVDYVWSNWDPQTMLQQFQQSAATRPDGIAIMGHPGDQAFDPLIDDAESKGIIVTSQNTTLPAAEARYAARGFGYVGAELYAAGQSLGEEAVRRFGLQKGDRAMVWGLLSQASRGLRTQGAIDALKKAGLTVDYLEIDSATNADPAQGTPAFSAYVASHPNVKLVVIDHGGLTATAQTYLQAANKRPGDIKVAGFDLSPAAVAAIKGGWTSLVLDQQEWLQGYLPVLQVCLTKTYGFSGLHINTGAGFVDQSNVDLVAPLAAQNIR